MANADFCQRFIFENQDIRGELVNLSESFQDLLRHKEYPLPVKSLLGEFLVASVLLSSTIKFDGRLVIQARSKGQIPLIMAECTSDKAIRGIATFRDEFIEESFNDLLCEGVLAITIEPEKGESYQGIVPLEEADLAHCLQEYFARSEQLDTRLLLFSRSDQCAGMLLQQLPPQLETDPARREDGWNTITQLAATLAEDELMQLNNEQILYRLFNQHPVTLYPGQNVFHQCSCSRERTARALIAIGREEVMDIAAQNRKQNTEFLDSALEAEKAERAGEALSEDTIEISCEFCGRLHKFDGDELNLLFAGTPPNLLH